MNCPICKKRQGAIVERSVEKTFGELYFCKHCDVIYLGYYADVAYVESLYEGNKIVHRANVSDSPSVPRLKYDDAQSRVDWVKNYSSTEKTLVEIGCGDGSFLRGIRESFRSVSGVELTAAHRTSVESYGIECFSILHDDLIRSADVICMFAVLEHIPDVTDFIARLKRFAKDGVQIFIEVPNRENVLVSQVDLPTFRSHYYRPEHLYYFSERALNRLFINSGFDANIQTVQQASLTNFFHWLYTGVKQPYSNHMTSVTLPVPHYSNSIIDVLDKVDDYYRQVLCEGGLGDLLRVHLRNRK